MSNKIKTGGPAFPVHPEVNQDGYSAGMTLRDYFAAKAMQGMLSHPEIDYSPIAGSTINAVVVDAYEIADAMIAARERT